MKRWAHRAHLVLLYLLLIAEALQFYAAGLVVYGRPSIHAGNGWLMLLVAIVCLVLAAIHRRSRRVVVGSVLLAVCMVLQPVFVFGLVGVSIYLAALHPLNALAIVALTVLLILDARRARIQP